MKKIFILVGIVTTFTGFSFAWGPNDFSLSFTGDTKQIAISSNTSTPTQICTKDSYIQRTWIVNSSTYTLYLSTISAGISTSSSFALPGDPTGTQPFQWSPDGVNGPFQGQIFAVSSAGTGPLPTISIFRSK